MPKQVIVIMDDHYPFGQCQQSTSQMTRVLVRKIYQTSIQERNKILEKASMIRKLKSQQLIKIQSILQQQETVHFLFQYVPIRLQTWISNINDQFIENFRDQLIKFSSYLANNFIKLQFKLKNIGMDHNYGAKYFLDPINFAYDPSVNKQRLKSQYIRDITNLFKPYIQRNQQQEQKTVYSNQRSNNNNNQITQNKQINQYPSQPTKRNNTAFSPPTFNQQVSTNLTTSNKTKQKLEKYYQQMNASMDVQNQKILAQFMNVLDDQQQQEQVPQPKKVQQIQPNSQTQQNSQNQQNQEVNTKYLSNLNNERQQQRSREISSQKKNINQVQVSNNQINNNIAKPNAGANTSTNNNTNTNPNTYNNYSNNKNIHHSSSLQNPQINHQQSQYTHNQPQLINNNSNSNTNSKALSYQQNSQSTYNQINPNNNNNSANNISNNTVLAPPKIIKNSQIQMQSQDKQEDQLQNRVRKAIQNSKNVIKRFRAMKQGTS